MRKAIERIGIFYRVTYIFAVAVLVALTIALRGSVLSLTLTLCGLTATVLNTGGLKLCYPLYLTQALLYGALSLRNHFYGEAVINLLYAAPMYIGSIIRWRRQTDKRVVTDIFSLPMKRAALGIVLLALFIPLYGRVLILAGTREPFLNAASTGLFVAVIYLVAKRYIQQWLVWIAFSAIQFALWASTFSVSYDNIPIVASNVFFIAIDLAGYFTWRKLKLYLDEKRDTL